MDGMSLKYFLEVVSKMCRNEKYIVVTKFITDFKYPLRFDDEFWVRGYVVRTSDASLHAQQDIYRSDGKNILLSKAVLIGMESTNRFRLPQIIIDTYPERPAPDIAHRNPNVESILPVHGPLANGSRHVI